MRSYPLLFAGLLSLIACGRPSHPSAPSAPAGTPAASQAAEVVRIADEYVAAYSERFPEIAEQLGLELAHHDGLTDNSLRARDAFRAKEDVWAARLEPIDAHALWGRPEWTTLGFVREAVAASRQARVCEGELWPVSQLSGWVSSMTETAQSQPVGTDIARREALARFGKLPGYLRTEIDNAREGARRGYTTPQRNVDLVLEQLDALLAAPPATWPLASPADRDSDAEFKRAWVVLLSGPVTEAVRAYRDFLRNEYRAKARQSQAIVANPNGAACYRAALRQVTSLDRSSDEVAALGMKTVETNLREALAIGHDKLGTSDLASLVHILDGPQSHFQSPEEDLAFARAAVTRGEAAAKGAFVALPPSGVRVEPYPKEEGPTQSDGYFGPSSGRPYGVYRINLLRATETTRFDAEITAFHETFPGHHLQIGTALTLPGAHPITHIVETTAYVEGWARYAEGLAEELGLYSSDASRAQRRLWAARGMVLDPGFHVQGWSRERVIAFVEESGRFTGKVAEDLVDRIAVWPGQLTAYDSGGLEFMALRAEAQRELGPRFDLRAFHAAVLGHGGVTLPMLRDLVHEWIREQKAKG